MSSLQFRRVQNFLAYGFASNPTARRVRRVQMAHFYDTDFRWYDEKRHQFFMNPYLVIFSRHSSWPGLPFQKKAGRFLNEYYDIFSWFLVQKYVNKKTTRFQKLVVFWVVKTTQKNDQLLKLGRFFFRKKRHMCRFYF